MGKAEPVKAKVPEPTCTEAGSLFNDLKIIFGQSAMPKAGPGGAGAMPRPAEGWRAEKDRKAENYRKVALVKKENEARKAAVNQYEDPYDWGNKQKGRFAKFDYPRQ